MKHFSERGCGLVWGAWENKPWCVDDENVEEALAACYCLRAAGLHQHQPGLPTSSGVEPWPLATVFGLRDSINTNPRSQKQLLIDTVLRNYEIPKLYWRVANLSGPRYDVVDGQQRLRTVCEFCQGKFKLPKDADPVEGHKIAGLTYERLPHQLRIRFDTYALDIVEIDDADEDEVREMFLRLQNGTSLRAQEKRNAYPGRMRDTVRELAGPPSSSASASQTRGTRTTWSPPSSSGWRRKGGQRMSRTVTLTTCIKKAVTSHLTPMHPRKSGEFLTCSPRSFQRKRRRTRSFISLESGGGNGKAIQ